MDINLSLEVALFLFFIALVASWVDVLAGGGGLITLPALLLVGVPPHSALATNKLQASFGTLISSWYFIRKKIVNIKENKLMILMTLLGSVGGSWYALQVDASFLNNILPFMLITIGFYYLYMPSTANIHRAKKVSYVLFSIMIASLLGFYDGFFGPGAGMLMGFSFVGLYGVSLLQATAYVKVLNFTSNISSLSYFILFGNINYKLGLIMVAGQIIGASIGANMAIKYNSKLIKPVIVVVCFAMSILIFLK